MALAKHRELPAAVSGLQKIRYSAGEIAYAKRRQAMKQRPVTGFHLLAINL